jgi:hypothetical protein
MDGNPVDHVDEFLASLQVVSKKGILDVNLVDTFIHTIGTLATQGPEMCERIGSNGGIEFMIASMPTFYSNSGYISHEYQHYDVLVAIEKLLSTTGNVELFCDLDGFRYVRNFTIWFHQNEEIQMAAMKIVNTVIQTNPYSYNEIGDQTAIRLLLEQFHYHPSDAEVVQAAFVTMNHIGVNGGSIEVINKLGALGEFLKAMTTHKFDQTIQKNGMEIMLQLLRNKVNCYSQQPNFLLVILTAMLNHIADEDITQLGVGILWHVHETEKLRI